MALELFVAVAAPLVVWAEVGIVHAFLPADRLRGSRYRAVLTTVFAAVWFSLPRLFKSTGSVFADDPAIALNLLILCSVVPKALVAWALTKFRLTAFPEHPAPGLFRCTLATLIASCFAYAGLYCLLVLTTSRFAA